MILYADMQIFSTFKHNSKTKYIIVHQLSLAVRKPRLDQFPTVFFFLKYEKYDHRCSPA